jgi:hypothetical protein
MFNAQRALRSLARRQREYLAWQAFTAAGGLAAVEQEVDRLALDRAAPAAPRPAGPLFALEQEAAAMHARLEAEREREQDLARPLVVRAMFAEANIVPRSAQVALERDQAAQEPRQQPTGAPVSLEGAKALMFSAINVVPRSQAPTEDAQVEAAKQSGRVALESEFRAIAAGNRSVDYGRLARLMVREHTGGGQPERVSTVIALSG